MTLHEFKALLLTADPKLTKFWGHKEEDYTVWTPGGIDRELADDEDENLVQRVYVDRFTSNDNDKIAKKLWKVLEKNNIPFEYEQDFEADTKVIHHSFACYVPIR